MTFIWHWPQITLAIGLALNVAIHAANDGKPVKDSKYQFGMSCVRAAIWLTLLYFGGFWTGGEP